jgi:hypothetical protein
MHDYEVTVSMEATFAFDWEHWELDWSNGSAFGVGLK